MKLIPFLMLIALAACSSAEKKKDEPALVKNEQFKKERPLKDSEVADYYAGNESKLNPALQDETLDRHTPEEIQQMSGSKDPLLEISLRCSKGDFNNAFAVASRSFDRYQKVAAYWNLIGNCHLNQKAFRKALLFYNKALEVKPNYVPALNNIGVMYSRQGQDQKALVAFERANKHSKFAKTPRYNMAKLYLRYGLAETALSTFEGLLSDTPQDVDILNAVATCRFLISDYEGALSYYQRIPRALWNQPEIGINIALTLQKAGRGEDARKIFSAIERPRNQELSRYYATAEKHIGEK